MSTVAPVLRSKIQPPPLRTSTLSRQRLIDRLATATQSRVTLIVAEAGYGKTTLLADFSRRFDGTCLWYSLESSDGDWFTVINHLLAAAREARPDFGQATAALLRLEPGMPPPKEAATASFLQELEAFDDERTVLILDDIHNVDECGDAKELLLRLMRDAPRGFSFVLTSRHRPSLGLARWAGMGELVELATDDLRFSPEETARLFSDAYGRPLEPDVLHEVDTRLRGWAACLQLFSTRINGLSPSAVRTAAESLSGSRDPLYEYLAQEVVANLSVQLQAFLTRAAILQVVTPERLQALFPDERHEALEGWTAECDALGLLTRASQSGGIRHFHPLMRDFLLGELARRETPERIADFHASVARASEDDPLTACHHYIEAGMLDEAMRALGSSTLQAMGSGRWGTAAALAARLGGQSHNGAVAAIQARRLLEEGDVASAASVLDSVDIGQEDPVVRAVLRHTMLTLTWRAGDTTRLLSTLADVLADRETPLLLRDIAEVFVDSSSLAEHPPSLSELAVRLERMADAQQSSGYGYYSAISLHNAGICALFAGDRGRAVTLGRRAIERFEQLTIRPPEYYSAHSQLATAYREAGQGAMADAHAKESQSHGVEHADVPAETGFDLAILGERHQAARLLLSVDELRRAGRSDAQSICTATIARAFLMLPTNPSGALEVLEELPPELPLELGYAGRRFVTRTLCHLIGGDRPSALAVARAGVTEARRRGNRRCEVRLKVLVALARLDKRGLTSAVAEAVQVSEMAILELADAIGMHLDLVERECGDIESSASKWPSRWLPVLRRQLELGDDPKARIAAELLDRYGDVEDVSRLRAFEKTYRRRGTTPDLGRSLSRRVSPRLQIHDLGQVSLQVGERMVSLARTRRKPAALLMYLVTRPNFTATREQVIEDLWPDGDVTSGLNSLNQSLYFIRREIDPWYEDDLSPEYLAYQAELVAIDPELTIVDSAQFVMKSRQAMDNPFHAEKALELMGMYRGQFCPEFEYEDWAIAWRTRVHAAYLDFARSALVRLAAGGELRSACDVALRVLAVDPSAEDIERNLIWLYWHGGARSAAEAHFTHVADRDRSDGLEPPTLREIVSRRLPE